MLGSQTWRMAPTASRKAILQAVLHGKTQHTRTAGMAFSVAVEKVADDTGAPGTLMRRHYSAMHCGLCSNQTSCVERRYTDVGLSWVPSTANR